MVNLETLLTSYTAAESLSSVLDLLESLGFETTGWQEGRIQKTMVTTFATILAELSEVVTFTAAAGSNEEAEGVALHLYTKSRYDEDVFAAVATEGPLTFTSVAAIPYTVATGGIIAATDTGVKFRLAEDVVVAAGTVAAPTTTTAHFVCTQEGAVGNVVSGAVRRLLTPLAGVTVNNIGSPWYTVAGKDVEGDEALRARNISKWARLTVELIGASYENIAREAGAVKVHVDDTNPRGPGTIDVYVSAASALLSDAELSPIQAAFFTRTFGTEEDWPTTAASTVSVYHPSVQDLDVSAILYHRSDVASSVIVERARAALTALLGRTPIGGFDYTPGSGVFANALSLDDIREALRHVAGVRTIQLATPAGSVSVGTNNLLIEGVWTLTPVPV